MGVHMLKQYLKALLLLILPIMVIVGCSSSEEESVEVDSTDAEVDEEVSEDVEESTDESSEASEEEEHEYSEDEKEGDDLSNAEKTTNDDDDDVYVFPLGKEGKFREWMYQYSTVVEVNDFFITDTLPDKVYQEEALKEPDEGKKQAVIEVTFKNDGVHSEFADDDTTDTNIGQSFVLRPDLERNTEENTINEGGNVHFANGEFMDDTYSLEPGDEETIFIVFEIDEDRADEDEYYLSYQDYGDVIYAWALQE